MGQYLKGNSMAQIKIHNGGYYAHTKTSRICNFCLSWNSTKFTRMFMELYLNGNNMAPIKNHMHMCKFLILITPI